MKVYVVSVGEYSDVRVVGIYSDKSVADAVFAGFAGHAFMEEFVVDAGPRPPRESGLKPWRVTSDWKSINVAFCDQIDDGRDFNGRTFGVVWADEGGLPFSVNLWARDKAHATKIAADKFREFVAMQPVYGGAAEEGDGA